MEKERSKLVSSIISILLACFLGRNFVVPVMSINGFEEQKNFFFPAPPDPHTGTVPSGSHGGSPPTHGSGGGYHPTPTPSTPSGRDCGTPPHEPSTPSKPSHSPLHGGYNNYHHSPPTPATVSPPSTPVNDPGSPHLGGTCDFWRSHPALIWGVLGWWGNVGSAFGVASIPGFGSTMSLPQALSNTRNNGVGALYREGTASFLNSMVNKRFPFSTTHVRESFVAALGSNSAAAAQAHIFKLANEGHLKPRD